MKNISLFERFMKSVNIQENATGNEPQIFDEVTIKELLQNSDFHKGRISAVHEDNELIGWLIEGNDTVLMPDRSDIDISYIVKMKPVANDGYKVKILLFPKEEGKESDIVVKFEFKGTVSEIQDNFEQTSYLENYIYDVGFAEDEYEPIYQSKSSK
jgi:hypothetical protein